jgi:hypothetical protein
MLREGGVEKAGRGLGLRLVIQEFDLRCCFGNLSIRINTDSIAVAIHRFYESGDGGNPCLASDPSMLGGSAVMLMHGLDLCSVENLQTRLHCWDIGAGPTKYAMHGVGYIDYFCFGRMGWVTLVFMFVSMVSLLTVGEFCVWECVCGDE